MLQDDHTNSDSTEANKKHNSISHAGLRWILIAGCILFIALLFLSIFLPNLSERVKFFTTNALSFLVLVVIIVQAYIYRRQWEAMEDSLAETRKMVAQNERAVIASEMQAKSAEHATQVASEAMAVQMRPYVAAQAVIKSFEADKPIKIELYFLNEGNSPALDLTARYFATHQSSPQPPDESGHRGENTGTLMILPHRKRTHYITLSPLTGAQVDAIKAESPSYFFFFFGHGKYIGVGGEYEFDFCYVYRPEVDGLGECSDFRTTGVKIH